MVSTPAPVPQPGTDARPVNSGERLILLDVLRGFALGGVFVSNAYMYFSGRAYLPRERAEALMSAPGDAVAHHLFEYLVAGKAMTLFSFLFGLGFAIQLGRAEERGVSIVSVYTRRLGVLLLLGLTHLFTLWHGDVLSLYATMGFVLLLFRKVPDRRLLLWGLVLILGGPLVISALQKFVPLLASSPEVVQAEARATMARVAAIRSQTLRAFESDSYLAGVRANARFYLDFFLVRPVFVAYMLVALGRFLLGLWAGRRRLFHDVGQHLSFFRRLLGWSLVAAVLGNLAGGLIPYLWSQGVLSRGQAWTFFRQFMAEGGVLGLATFYAAGLSLLFQRERWRRLLRVLAPAGQMALTNYLCQTGVGLLLFRGFGLGLIGKMGSLACLSLMFGLFWVQVGVSHLWLARFRFGPAEWLWRSLTYGRLQPMRLGPGRDERDLQPAPK
jgi:uncharacterized protein